MKRSVALISFLLLPTSVFAVIACSSLSINTSGAEEVTAESVLTQSSGQQLAQSNEVPIELSPEAEQDLTEIAKAITVKISTQNNGGSGVLIGKQGNNYLILTNAHVVRGGETFEIKTEDSQTHQANLVSNFISVDYDLALLQFNSNRTYEVATLSELPVEPELIAFAAGYSAQTGKLVTNSGQVARFPDQSLKNGYQIGYTSEIEQGMSGGSILDEEGELIGINGKGSFPIINTAYVYQDGTQPQPEEIEAMRQLSWGIPTNTVLGQLNSDLITAYNLPQPEIAEANTPALTGWLGELEAKAKQITVKIDNTNGLSNGSGVIIAKEGNSYAVLTADHVICERDNATQPCRDFVYEIVTHDGQRHQIEADKTRREEGVDLAVVRFTSDENYQVAQLANYPLTESDAVFVAGYPRVSNNTSAQWKFSLGFGWDREGGLTIVSDNSLTKDSADFFTSNQGSLSGGYEMVYSSITYGGMSGGAVLDRDGRVIGIHGLAEGETTFDKQNGSEKQIQLGYSLGIPTNTFIDLANRLEIASLPIQNNRPKKLNSVETKSFADAILETEISQSNVSPEKWLERGNQLWRLRRYEEALTAFDRVIAFSPEFIHLAYYGKGLTFFYKREDINALTSFEQATKSQPNFVPALFYISNIFKDLNRLDDALVAIEKAIILEQENANLHFVKGTILSELKRYSEAEIAYSKAIQFIPRANFYSSRGLLYREQGNFELALADYNKAIELNPNNSSAYNNRGLFYKEQGDFKLALADYNHALQLNPNYSGAYNNRGNLYKEQGNFALALADYNRALQLHPNGAGTYYNRANFYAKQKNFELSLADYNKAIKLNSNYVEAYNNRGLLYFHNIANYQLALADFNKAIELNRNYNELYINRGLLYFKQGKLKLALADYNKAIKLSPDSVESHINRGILYAKQGNFELALADYDKAIELNPNDVDAYFNKGSLYVNQGNFKLALAHFNMAIKLNPNDAVAYFYRGNIYAEQEKFELALADYNRVLQLNPNYISAYFNRGNIYVKQEKIKLALADYSKTIELNSSDADAYYNRGVLYSKQGNLELALADYNKTIEFNPNHVGAYVDRGLIYSYGDKLDLALADFEKAIIVNPNIPNTYIGLGLTYQKKGDIEAAQANFQKAQELSIAQGNTALAEQAASFLQQLP